MNPSAVQISSQIPALAAGLFQRARLRAGVVLFMGLTLSLLAAAAPPVVGQALTPLVSSDQHDKPWRTEPATRQLLFTADKAGGELVTEALRGQGAAVLSSRQALYLADIHAMPALVTKLFAMPALRDQPYAIGLARNETLAADLPRQKAQVTLITLREGLVESLQYLSSVAEVRRALSLPEH
jgi:hypothetical protein